MTRAAGRRLAFGLATLAGMPRGWFLPSRYADSARPTPSPALGTLFEASETAMRQAVATIERFADALQQIAWDAPAPAPRWNQDWFPGLDLALMYAELRARPPNSVLEIGSGHSTRVIAAALKAAAASSTIVTAIDPAPRADLADLPIRLVRAPLQSLAREALPELARDDVLSIDASHIAMPGTELDRFVSDMLPRLPEGVRVHFHDVTLPDPYPEAWRWRGYNEQLLVAALLTSGAFALRVSSHWLRYHRPHWLGNGAASRLRRPTGAWETSIWLEKRTPAVIAALGVAEGR